MNIKVKFTKDIDESYEAYEEKGININHIPRVGECLRINNFYHRIIDVVYFERSADIELHLGKSAQSPEEARSKGYGIWNS